MEPHTSPDTEQRRILRLANTIAVTVRQFLRLRCFFLICAKGAVSDRVNRLQGARGHDGAVSAHRYSSDYHDFRHDDQTKNHRTTC